MSKTPVVRVEGTEALLSVVPVLLGYEPADSVVVLTVRDRRVGMTGRVDLPQNAEEAHAMVDSLVPPILRQQPESVFLIGYEKVTTRPLTAAARTTPFTSWCRLCPATGSPGPPPSPAGTSVASRRRGPS